GTPRSDTPRIIFKSRGTDPRGLRSVNGGTRKPGNTRRTVWDGFGLTAPRPWRHRMIPSTHLSLLVALKASGGREAAWGQFHRRYHETITRWCIRHGLQAADAEDVTQAVWTRLL